MASDSPENKARSADIAAYILIALATFLVFSGSLRNGFLTWDDDVNFLTSAGAVIHLAAITNAAGSFDNQAQVELVNYKGT